MHWIRWYANTKIQKYKYTITGLLEWKPLEALDPSSPPLPFSTSSASWPLPRTGSGTTWRGNNQPGLDSVSSARVGSVQETTTSTNKNKQTTNKQTNNKHTRTEGRATNQDWAVCRQLSKIWFCASSKAWLWKVQFYSFLKLWQWFGSSKINDQQQHAIDFPKSRLAEMGALNKYRQQMFAICISWPWPSNSWIFLRLQLSHHTFSTSQWRRKTRKKLLLRLNNTAAQHQKDSAGNSKPNFWQTARVTLNVSDL